MKFAFVLFLAFSASVCHGMFVESYWESWVLKDYGPNDFCSYLKDVPATPVGSTTGVNYVDVGEIQYQFDMFLNYFVIASYQHTAVAKCEIDARFYPIVPIKNL